MSRSTEASPFLESEPSFRSNATRPPTVVQTTTQTVDRGSRHRRGFRPLHTIVTLVQTLVVFTGLAGAVFAAALTQTIAATALVGRSSSLLDAASLALNQATDLKWVAQALWLAGVPSVLVQGHLADVFGRKPVYLLCLVLFGFGSILSGAASNMTMLIVGRAFTGMGAVAIFPLSVIIASDMTTPRLRPAFIGVLCAVFGLASLLGPSIGGAFVDGGVTWRWAFYMNIFLLLVPFLCVLLFLPHHHHSSNVRENAKSLDWLGVVLLLAGMLCILVPIQTGGDQYAWNSASTISLLIVGLILLFAFAFVEGWLARQPLVPTLSVHTIAAYAASFCLGAVFYVIVFYAGVWFEVSFGSSVTGAGFHTIPVFVTFAIFAVVTGVAITVTGHFYAFPILSGLILAIGCGLWTSMNSYASLGKQIFYLLLMGLGLGFGLPGIFVSALEASPGLSAAVVSQSHFVFLLGGLIAQAIVGSRVRETLARNLLASLYNRSTPLHLPASLSLEAVFAGPGGVRGATGVAQDVWDALAGGYLDTFGGVFWVPFGFALGVLVFAVGGQVGKVTWDEDGKAI